MSGSAHAVHYAWHEYLALESASNVKHEYLDGQIYAMAGGTPEHAALQLAVPNLLSFRCFAPAAAAPTARASAFTTFLCARGAREGAH